MTDNHKPSKHEVIALLKPIAERTSTDGKYAMPITCRPDPTKPDVESNRKGWEVEIAFTDEAERDRVLNAIGLYFTGTPAIAAKETRVETHHYFTDLKCITPVACLLQGELADKLTIFMRNNDIDHGWEENRSGAFPQETCGGIGTTVAAVFGRVFAK